MKTVENFTVNNLIKHMWLCKKYIKETDIAIFETAYYRSNPPQRITCFVNPEEVRQNNTHSENCMI